MIRSGRVLHIAVISATTSRLDALWQPLVNEQDYAFFAMDPPTTVDETFISQGLSFCWTHHCHIALLDLQHAPTRPHMIALAERLHTTARVLTVDGLVHPEDRAIWTRLLRDHVVFEDLQSDDSNALRQVLQFAWADPKWRNVNLPITPESPVTNFKIAETLQIEAERDLDQQLPYLLERLFHDAEQIHIEPMTGTLNSTSAKPAHSVVLKITEKRSGKWLQKNPRVLKINRVSRSDFGSDLGYSEDERYRRYVDQRIDYDLHARLIQSHTFWDISCSVYQFQGNSVGDFRTFREFFLQTSVKDVKDITTVIQNLFGRTLHNWYAIPEQRDPKNTFMLMAEYLSLHKRIEYAVAQPHEIPQPQWVKLPKLDEPFGWIRERGLVDTPFNTHVAHETICHGDLHGGNILVDRHGQAWLIDFEKTGPAHILRDFVELESDIKLRLSEIEPDDYKTALALNVALLRNKSCHEPLEANAHIRQHPGAMKAFEAIVAIRKFAIERADPNDMAEYYWALLAETAFVSLYHRGREATRAHAHLSAALICDRLKHWNQLDWSREWFKHYS